MELKFFVYLITDDDTGAHLFDVTRADGLRLTYVPASTNTLALRKALKTLFPGCVVVFRD